MAVNVCCCPVGESVPCCFPQEATPQDPCPGVFCSDVPAGEEPDKWSICRQLGGFKPLNMEDDPPPTSCIFGPHPRCMPLGFCPDTINLLYGGLSLCTGTCTQGLIFLPCSPVRIPVNHTIVLASNPPQGGIAKSGSSSCCFLATNGPEGYSIDTSGRWCSQFDQHDTLPHTSDFCGNIDIRTVGFTMVNVFVGPNDAGFSATLAWGYLHRYDVTCLGPRANQAVPPCGFYPEQYNYVAEVSHRFRFLVSGSGCSADVIRGEPMIWRHNGPAIECNLANTDGSCNGAPTASLRIEQGAEVRVSL